MQAHPAFATAPDSIKVAVDGAWEQAVTLRVGEDLSSLAMVSVDSASDVACEAFFESAFFGVRHVGTPRQLSDFVGTFAAAAASSDSGPALFERIAAAGGVEVGRHFRYCELGAEGAWRSVGPMRIEDPAAALADSDTLWAAVCSAPVAHDTSHPKALEFTFANRPGLDDTTHWFALPVSVGNRIDRAALESALAAYP